jgi:hypothetical protein
MVAKKNAQQWANIAKISIPRSICILSNT